VKSGEDSKYVFTCREAIDSYDISFTADIELGYQNVHSVGRNIMGSHTCINCTDTYYSENCTNCHNIFGCDGLKSAEYCILNKQYTKGEYEVLLPKLIEHMRKTNEWGEYFPKEMIPFAYNESVANEYFPLTKEEAIQKGYRWEDDIPRTRGQETVSNDELPKNPKLFSNELIAQVLKCDTCGYNYKLTLQEITFYKRIGVIIPRDCYNCRHELRMKSRNARVLWPGVCANCKKEIQTPYNPEDQKKYRIYCEECYKSEVA
jgi:CxxC-x17-CxxC domain-containing protein